MLLKITSYRDLKGWQTAVEIAVECYRQTEQFPRSEIFGLTAQIRRASVSVAANIAEGHGRETTGSFVQFLRVAQGSLKELETHLIIAERTGALKDPDFQMLIVKCDENGKMLRALIRSMQDK